MTDVDTRKLFADLERDEGFSASAYQDSRGYWTIGYGTLIDKAAGGGISRAHAAMIAQDAIESKRAELYRAHPWIRDLDEPRHRALINMAYNLGVPRLCGFKNMLGALQRGDWQKAHDDALNSRWATQVGERAQRIADVFLTGKD